MQNITPSFSKSDVKSLRRFGIVIFFVGLYISFFSPFYFPSEIINVKGLIFCELFDWMFFYTIFLIIAGANLFIPSVESYRSIPSIRTIAFMTLILLLIPGILELTSFLIHFPLHIFANLNLASLAIMIASIVKLVKYKKNRILKFKWGENLITSKTIVLIIIFCLNSTLLAYKSVEFLLNLKNTISYKEYQSSQIGMNKDEITKLVGQPYLKFLSFDDKSEQFTVLLQNGKVKRIYHQYYSKLSGKTEKEVLKLFGKPSRERWIYSYSPYEGAASSRSIDIRGGVYAPFWLPFLKRKNNLKI